MANVCLGHPGPCKNLWLTVIENFEFNGLFHLIAAAPRNYYEMSSFPETKAEKYCNGQKCQDLVHHNKIQVTRIYPKGQRIDSSNYDPFPFWLCGAHLCALNYQTPGKLNNIDNFLYGHWRFILYEVMMFDTFPPINHSRLIKSVCYYY